jgi:hypothetical protein
MRVFRVLGVVLVVITAFLDNAAAQIASPAATPWRSARYYGGTDYEFAERVVVDARGNSYFLGYTFSTDMDASIVPVSRGSGEPASATFVYKLTPDGARFYATTVGTGLAVRPIDLAAASDGSAHVLLRDGDVHHAIRLDAAGGETMHVTFDPRAASPIHPRAIAVDAVGNTVIAGWSADGLFVARIDARGTLFGAYRIGRSADVRDLAVDAAGNAYVVGIAFAGDIPTTAGALQPQFKAGDCPAPMQLPANPPRTSPCTDAFVVKITPTGTIAYATYLGGTGWEDGRTIAVDASGSAVVVGETHSPDLPLVRPADQQCRPGLLLRCADSYIARLDPTGSSLVFSTYLGVFSIGSVAVDAAGNVYAGGSTIGDQAVTRAPQPEFGGGDGDGFLTAYSAAGQLLWSTYVGGSREEGVAGIGVAAGVVYFGG